MARRKVRPSSTSRRAADEAAAIGTELARAEVRRRLAARRSRAGALGERPLARAGATGRAVAATAIRSNGVLVAEGDSWFDYPWCDVLKVLEDEYAYDVESVAHKGDRVEDMAYSGGQLEAFTRQLERVRRRGQRPRAILLSGGGNDVAGDSFELLLQHARSSAPGLNPDVVRGVIDGRIGPAYVTILGSVLEACDGLLGARPPVLVHGYDYPVPDGRGFMGGFWLLPGPWLEPGFRAKGYRELQGRIGIARELIDRFNDMLREVCSQPRFRRSVTYLDLRGTLSTGRGYRKDWANELHPTPRGWRQVAARFAAELGALPAPPPEPA